MNFSDRHIGTSAPDQALMLKKIGYASLDACIAATLPEQFPPEPTLDLPSPIAEHEVIDALRTIASKNKLVKNMIGLGYHDTITPPVILRNFFENAGWYTAYTPYQAEISQGRLELLMNYQQMIIDLTAMEVANASMLDEASCAAEAMLMAYRISNNKNSVFYVDSGCHPQVIAVVKTVAEPLQIQVKMFDASNIESTDFSCFSALLSYPDTYGAICAPTGVRALAQRLHANNAMLIVTCDLLALTMLHPPGALGADIAIGSAQRFGVPLGCGGPHAAFMACNKIHMRQIPGRIIGVSLDRRGKPAYRMALQTREQHIRREKATSNICTAQVLLANMAALYAQYHGNSGLKAMAQRVHGYAVTLAAALQQGGYIIQHTVFFDTLRVGCIDAATLVARCEQQGITIRYIDATHVGISCNEATDDTVIATLLDVCNAKPADATSPLHAEYCRDDDWLTHPHFTTLRSETQMLRYLRKLQVRDIALDFSMIALGSCTMKLNAAAQMIALSWQEFTNVHPFAPAALRAGYQDIMEQLGSYLCAITGFDAVSMQPNSGSQGEYAGLLAIRQYFASIGQGEQRKICIIPDSAHGTNPASAVKAGLRVVIVKSGANGNISLAALQASIATHGDAIAVLMVTYPSTHGVFEDEIITICAMIHHVGGQVYMDGANMNAMTGLVQPASLGADVMHLNLHKTFCIPHGGGGPGSGPIGLKAHLAPWGTGFVYPQSIQQQTSASVATPPNGSALIAIITWAYIRMMGDAGLTHAAKSAILHANYIAHQLGDAYPILYRGSRGLVAHECIIDIRQIKAETGISEEDIAKRLIDYGFHAPTMAFPVAGTMMIEPTESEDLAEINRFCAAMLAIRAEITEISNNETLKTNNVLKNAPHHIDDLLGSWAYPYSKQQACFPLEWIIDNKYWPYVARIDNVYGDRNIFCSCPDVTAYSQE